MEQLGPLLLKVLLRLLARKTYFSVALYGVGVNAVCFHIVVDQSFGFFLIFYITITGVPQARW